MSGSEKERTLFHVPRSRALVVEGGGALSIGEHNVLHGESETSFVVAFRNYVKDAFAHYLISEGTAANIDKERICPALVVSEDTDFYIIPLCNT